MFRKLHILAFVLFVTLANAGITAHANGVHSKRFDLRFIGEVIFETGYIFAGTEVSGLSGLDYNKKEEIYYAISDDRSSAARFYTLAIDLSDGSLEDGDVEFKTVTTLLDKDGEPFEANTLDPESIRYSPTSRTLFWTSEGDATLLIPPFVRQMTLDGRFIRELKTPKKYIPVENGSSGIRNNLAFESLTFSTNKKSLYTATENALSQDGPPASLAEGSPSRVLQLRIRSDRPSKEYIYETDPVADAPIPVDAFSTNGLVEILAIGGGEFLTLERSFSVGIGNAVKIYRARIAGASSVGRLDSIQGRSIRPIEKELVLDLTKLGITLDNLEGMTFGPHLASGELTLILVSDNNFNPDGQFTQFLAFAMDR